MGCGDRRPIGEESEGKIRVGGADTILTPSRRRETAPPGGGKTSRESSGPGARDGRLRPAGAGQSRRAGEGREKMARKTVTINRAPVLTLWAGVVAERLGFDRDEALTLGKAVAGLNAQTKGRRLGIFKPGKEKGRKARERKRGEEFWVDICGRSVPAVNTEDGVRAVVWDKPIDPASVADYLQGKFGDDLDDVRDAMWALAKSMKPEQLADRAYALYEKFRPRIPRGKRGWGAKGDLDLELIRTLG